MLQTLAFVATGWIAGLIWRVLVVGPRHVGLIRTLLVGMVGAVAGGLVGGLLQSQPEALEVGPISLLGAFLGALVTLFVMTNLSRKRVHA